MRIEVLFDKKEKIAQGTMEALCKEMEKRITPVYPSARFRVAKSSATALLISGTKDNNEKEKIQSILQEIWEDDSWLPTG